MAIYAPQLSFKWITLKLWQALYISLQVEAIQINKDILKLLSIYMFEIMSSLQKNLKPRLIRELRLRS